MLFFLLLFVATLADRAYRENNKFYKTYPLPQQIWDDQGVTPYRHELVQNGLLLVDIRPRANYSVHPTTACDLKIGVVLQLLPPSDPPIADIRDRQRATCTISITIDDGHVEIWYGLCLSHTEYSERLFDFPLNPMSVVYFTFDKFSVIFYRRDSDSAPDYEMGRVEHVPPVKKSKDWIKFGAFLYHDACKDVSLKEVRHEDDWRQAKDTHHETESSSGSIFISRMLAIFSVPMAIGCLLLALMHVWSIGIPFPLFDGLLNWMFNAIFSRYNEKTGAIAQPTLEENKSCRSAEEPSEEWEGTGKKENLFMDKGRKKAPMRAPPGYALPDYDAPYEDDPEPCMQTAVAVEEVTAPPVVPNESGSQKPSEAPAGGVVV